LLHKFGLLRDSGHSQISLFLGSASCTQGKCSFEHNKRQRNWFSNPIKTLKPIRTLSLVGFKIRPSKPKFCSSVNEKTEKFLNFSKQNRQQNENQQRTKMKAKKDADSHRIQAHF